MTDSEAKKALTKELAEIKSMVAQTLKTQSEEHVRTLGEATAESAKALKEQSEQYDRALADLRAENEKSAAEMKETKEIAEELQKQSQRPGWGGAGDDPKSVGEVFVTSDEVGLARKAKRQTTEAVPVKNLFQRKAAFLTPPAPHVVPQRAPMVLPLIRSPVVRDLVSVTTTTSNAIDYPEVTGFHATGAGSGTTGAAATVAEGDLVPEAELTTVMRNVAVTTIAHSIPASLLILDDDSQMRQAIDGLLIDGLEFEEETQLIFGDGNNPNIQGISTHPNVQAYSQSSGPATDTEIDAIRRGATLTHIREYRPDAVVVHPSDWENIQLAKGTDDHYIWLNVSGGTEERLFRLVVVVTTAVPAKLGIVGAYRQSATIWDRMQSTIRVSEHHDQHFRRLMVEIMALERIALTITRPDAFVNITFT